MFESVTTQATKLAQATGDTRHSSGALARFWRMPAAIGGVIFILVEVLFVVFLPLVIPLDPYTSLPGYMSSGPIPGYPFGFDELGRDLFARIIYGGQVSLLVAFCATALSLIIGVPLGLVAGYFGGIIETIVMRFSDAFMAFPAMILILIFVSVAGQSITTLTIIMGVLSWPSFARLLHGRILSIREEEYIESARAVGTSNFIIICKYILPNSIAPVLVQATFAFSITMSIEAGLSFLGVGIKPPTASWGNILYAAKSISVLAYQPWVWLPAGAFFLATVFAVNFIGDGLRRALDPKSGR
ncbi:MAG: ABC transporter permease [Coriobacteriales bacterium]|jgi:peptide/nickel transport system permease protein|nr:ABC transporter permease [Coriobacteriales bacterium]